MCPRLLPCTAAAGRGLKAVSRSDRVVSTTNSCHVSPLGNDYFAPVDLNRPILLADAQGKN